MMRLRVYVSKRVRTFWPQALFVELCRTVNEWPRMCLRVCVYACSHVSATSLVCWKVSDSHDVFTCMCVCVFTCLGHKPCLSNIVGLLRSRAEAVCFVCREHSCFLLALSALGCVFGFSRGLEKQAALPLAFLRMSTYVCVYQMSMYASMCVYLCVYVCLRVYVCVCACAACSHSRFEGAHVLANTYWRFQCSQWVKTVLCSLVLCWLYTQIHLKDTSVHCYLASRTVYQIRLQHCSTLHIYVTCYLHVPARTEGRACLHAQRAERCVSACNYKYWELSLCLHVLAPGLRLSAMFLHVSRADQVSSYAGVYWEPGIFLHVSACIENWQSIFRCWAILKAEHVYSCFLSCNSRVRPSVIQRKVVFPCGLCQHLC